MPHPNDTNAQMHNNDATSVTFFFQYFCRISFMLWQDIKVQIELQKNLRLEQETEAEFHLVVNFWTMHNIFIHRQSIRQFKCPCRSFV